MNIFVYQLFYKGVFNNMLVMLCVCLFQEDALAGVWAPGSPVALEGSAGVRGHRLRRPAAGAHLQQEVRGHMRFYYYYFF